MMKTEPQTTVEAPQAEYTREQVLASKKYRSHCDVLGAALEPGKQYTAKEIDAVRNNFLKRPIKEIINGKGK